MGSRKSGVIASVAAISLCSCTTNQSWLYRPPPRPPAPSSKLDGPLVDEKGKPQTRWFDGPLIRALNLAVTNFSGQFNPYVEDVLVQCLARPDAYDAELVREDTQQWIIYVRPRAERCFEGGSRLKGGDATYPETHDKPDALCRAARVASLSGAAPRRGHFRAHRRGSCGLWTNERCAGFGSELRRQPSGYHSPASLRRNSNGVLASRSAAAIVDNAG